MFLLEVGNLKENFAKYFSVEAAVDDALKREVVLHATTDDSMIGGVKLQVGDQLVDGSIATRLRQMRDQIERDGAARIRGALGSMLE